MLQAVQLPWNALKNVWERLGEFRELHVSKYCDVKVGTMIRETEAGGILKQDIGNKVSLTLSDTCGSNQPIGAPN